MTILLICSYSSFASFFFAVSSCIYEQTFFPFRNIHVFCCYSSLTHSPVKHTSDSLCYHSTAQHFTEHAKKYFVHNGTFFSSGVVSTRRVTAQRVASMLYRRVSETMDKNKMRKCFEMEKMSAQKC